MGSRARASVAVDWSSIALIALGIFPSSIKSMSLALAGRFLTTELPRKSNFLLYKDKLFMERGYTSELR